MLYRNVMTRAKGVNRGEKPGMERGREITENGFYSLKSDFFGAGRRIRAHFSAWGPFSEPVGSRKKSQYLGTAN
jgi:hypothetical protein